MNIYRVSRTDKVSYDEYAAIVVSANSEEKARKLWPGKHVWGKYTNKINPVSKEREIDTYNTDTLKVELIGSSLSNKEEIILEDYWNG